VLLAAGAPGAATAGTAADSTTAAHWQFDGSALLYGEQSRTNVVEPVARIARLLPNGQLLSAQLALDAITGASPSGALPSGQTTVQTVTSASGASSTTTTAGQIPTHHFSDLRGALDLGYDLPIGSLLVPSVMLHASREKDYQSLGVSGKLSVDLMHRLTTVTIGGGINRDGVFPKGGTLVPLDSTGTLLTRATNDKRVVTTLLGLSRILTRRWMVGVNVSRTLETGYLTEPYKVVSVLDPASGYTSGQFTEKRPSSRSREDVLTSSVYHLTEDVLYVSHRYYWDNWGIRSHTVDLKYRRDLDRESFLQPHVRFYTQTAADFFRFAVVQGSALPQFMSADERLGRLRTVTVGATYGVRVPQYPGAFTVRAEYIRQWGDGHPADVVGVQRTFDLFPAVSIGSLTAGYSVQF
jgi:hypothetical protein